MKKHRSGQGGFSLIEVLVALLITAIGLLGAGILITMGMKSATGSNQMSIATDLAQQGLDMMQANRLEAYRMLGNSVERATACGVADNLTANPLQRRRVWDCRLHQVLPGATAVWTLNNGIATVRISWDRERNASVAGENVQENTEIVLESRL